MNEEQIAEHIRSLDRQLVIEALEPLALLALHHEPDPNTPDDKRLVPVRLDLLRSACKTLFSDADFGTVLDYLDLRDRRKL